MNRRQAQIERSARTNPWVGVLTVVVMAIAIYVVFGRPDPLSDTFELKAVVSSSNGVREEFTPVRIAGVDVGKVTKIESYRGTSSALITMELDESALPLHADAAAKVRPRLFLEGNAFIDVSPGTPAAPVARDGLTIPLERTSVAVTFPHVLGALDSDTRRNLQGALQEYGSALNARPAPGDDATQDPSVHGLTAGEALNGALEHGAQAMAPSAVVSDAFRGESDGDLTRAIDDFADVAASLNDSGPQLSSMLSNLRQANAAFASESVAFTETLRELPDALEQSRAALREVRSALPPARDVAEATTASLPALPGALSTGVPWLREVRALLGPDELGADLDVLLPATRSLAPAVRPTTELLSEVDLLSRCSTRVLIPTANAKISDGPRTAGTSAWSEFLSAAVGANGSAQSFDGNGVMLRGNPGGGSAAVATGETRWLGEPGYGNALSRPLGTRPARPSELPPHEFDVPCHRNEAPNLNGTAARPGPADGSAR